GGGDDEAEAVPGRVGGVGPVGVAVAVVLVVARLVEKLLVGVEDVFSEEAVPRALPAGVALVFELVGPERRPTGGLVALGDAEGATCRVDVASDGLEIPRGAAAFLVLPKVGQIHDPQRVARVVADVGL